MRSEQLIVNTKRLAIVTVLALAAVLSIAGWITRDTRMINARFRRLTRLARKMPGESDLRALARAREASNIFVSKPDVRFGPFSTSDRQEIYAVLAHLRKSVDELRVSVKDRKTTVNSDRSKAVMTAAIEGVVTIRGQTDSDIVELKIDWVRGDSGWLIESAETRSSIRRPPGLDSVF